MQYLDPTTRLESARFQLRPDAVSARFQLRPDAAYRPSAYIRVSFPPSLLIIPNLCMPTCLRVRARVRLSTCVYVYIRA